MKRIEEIQVKVDKSDPEFVFTSLTSIPSSDMTQEVSCTPHQMCFNLHVIKTHSQRETVLLEYGGRCSSLFGSR